MADPPKKPKTYELVSKELREEARTLHFVTPDPDPDSLGQFNTIVLRPEYRLHMRLGDFDDLFADDISPPPVGTTVPEPPPAPRKKGRKERLQVLSWFNRPVNHPESDLCYDVVWKYYKEKLHKPALS